MGIVRDRSKLAPKVSGINSTQAERNIIHTA
jgi:hypothetical protein